MERGGVGAQPQCVLGRESFENTSLLRLVGDGTAALRDFPNTL